MLPFYKTGLALVVGTFVKFNIIHLLRYRKRSTATTIQVDDLVLLEHCINAINGPIIFLYFLKLTIPSHTMHIFEGFVFSSVRFLLAQLAFYHRIIGGLGIAGVRVFCISFPFAVLQIGADKVVKCTSGMICFLSILFAATS